MAGLFQRLGSGWAAGPFCWGLRGRTLGPLQPARSHTAPGQARPAQISGPYLPLSAPYNRLLPSVPALFALLVSYMHSRPCMSHSARLHALHCLLQALVALGLGAILLFLLSLEVLLPSSRLRLKSYRGFARPGLFLSLDLVLPFAQEVFIFLSASFFACTFRFACQLHAPRVRFAHAARLVRFLDALNGFVEALVALLFDALLL